MKAKDHFCNKQTSLKISESLTRRLATYSATAGAALLVAPVAHATIQNITSLSVSLDLPLNNNYETVPSFAGPFHGGFIGIRGIHNKYGPLSTVIPYRFGNVSMYGNIATTYGRAERLSKSDALVGLSFTNGSHVLAYQSNLNAVSAGNFLRQSGYVAFHTSAYYGWLKVKVGLDSNGVPDKVSLVDNGNGIYGAFDNVADIATDGFTAGAVAAPEPSIAAIGGLGLLAFGAIGVREMRRRRGKPKAQK